MTTMIVSPLAVGAIRFYQQVISPYKGFRCANRVRTRGWSCSEFGRRAFARFDIRTAWLLLQRRFACCRRAHLALSASAAAATLPPQGEVETKRAERRRRWSADCANSCDVPFGNASCDLPCDLSGAADVGACDCSL